MATTADADAAVVIRLIAALDDARRCNDDDNGGREQDNRQRHRQSHVSLTSWNDEIETSFGVGTAAAGRRTGGTTSGDNGGTSSPSAAAELLQSCLVDCVAAHPTLFAAAAGVATASREAEDEAAAGGGEGRAMAGSYSRGDSPDDVEADLAASEAARAVARASFSPSSNGATGDAADPSSGLRYEERLELASQLLRAAKNLIRYRNQARLSAGMGRFARGGGEEEDDPLRRLRSPGTLRLYLTLVDRCSSHAISALQRRRDGVARNASLALFHATYGHQSTNPAAARARAALVDDDGIGGIPILMRLLANDHGHPTPLTLSLVRHVHSLVASDSTVAERMDRALDELASSAAAFANNEQRGEDGQIGKSKSKKDLLSVLVAILARTVRSTTTTTTTTTMTADTNDLQQSPFPGTDAADRRADLACEILRVLFALRATGTVPPPSSEEGGEGDEGSGNGSGDGDRNNFDTMTQLGVILCDILRVPDGDDGRAYGCKLSAINLLMDAPRGYAHYLRSNGAIPPLLTVLRVQLDEVLGNRPGRSSVDDAAAVVPILAVLERMASEDEEVLRLVKEEIFPPDAEETYAARAKIETDKMGGGGGGVGGGSIRAKNMHPLDAPAGTLRWKLIRLMTWIESNVKRTSSELLWTVCGADPTEFVLRTGYGNAVHMLGIKGLVQIPKEGSSAVRL